MSWTELDDELRRRRVRDRERTITVVYDPAQNGSVRLAHPDGPPELLRADAEALERAAGIVAFWADRS